MKYVTRVAIAVFFAGLVALLLTANPFFALLGKFAIAASLVALAAVATTHAANVSFAAHALRNEDFHWY